MSTFMDSRELAARLGVVPETVRKWVRQGKLRPAGQLPGGQYRFTEEQILALLSAPKAMSPRARAIEDHVAEARAKLAAKRERRRAARRQNRGQ